MTDDAKPRRLRADAARNRQALIDAAQRLFAARGLSITLDDIAAEAGVNVATAYRHFANKHELAGAFLQQQIDHAGSIAEQAAAAEDPWQGITEFLERTLDLIAANRGLHDLFTPGSTGEALEQLAERIDPVLERLIGRAQAAGALREDVALGDLGVILQMLTGVTDIVSEDPAAMRRRYLGLVFAGLRPGPEPLPGAAPSPAEARKANMPRRPDRTA